LATPHEFEALWDIIFRHSLKRAGHGTEVFLHGAVSVANHGEAFAHATLVAMVDAIGERLAMITSVKVITSRVFKIRRYLRLLDRSAEVRLRFVHVARRLRRVLFVRVAAFDVNRNPLSFGAASAEFISFAPIPSFLVEKLQ
jgi:hypothetical protein